MPLPETRDQDDNTPLLQLVRSSSVAPPLLESDFLMYLLNGHDLMAVNRFGDTILHRIARTELCEFWMIRLFKLLDDPQFTHQHVKVRCLLNQANHKGRTPLHRLVRFMGRDQPALQDSEKPLIPLFCLYLMLWYGATLWMGDNDQVTPMKRVENHSETFQQRYTVADLPNELKSVAVRMSQQQMRLLARCDFKYYRALLSFIQEDRPDEQEGLAATMRMALKR